MSRIAHRTRTGIAAWAAGLLLACPLAAEEPGAAKMPACASLSGTWAGAFDGSANGAWIAEIRASASEFSATARILVNGAGGIEGAGTARLTCKDGSLSFEGTGNASGREATFSGFAHDGGRYLVGNWSAGGFSGTWNGERTQGAAARGVLPEVD
jgi:hypothetical protein